MHPLISALLTFYATYRAHSHKSLTPGGIACAVGTSIIHAIHPFSTLNMLLLFGFYFAGNSATKHKLAIKRTLTVSSTGNAGAGAVTRTHVQVLANSGIASLLILIHYILIFSDISAGRPVTFSLTGKNGWKDALVVGVMTQYAAVLSDTLSSELGILSKSSPRLIYNPLRTVPPGTNGGVTATGTLAGLAGSIFIAVISVFSVPFAPSASTTEFKLLLAGIITLSGLVGTVIDSLLGATLQASVIDVHHGKIVESDGGEKVLVVSGRYPSIVGKVRGKVGVGSEEPDKVVGRTKGVDGEVDAAPKGKEGSRRVYSGVDVLSNNAVNVSMAGIVAAGGVGWGLWYSGVL